MIDATSVPVLRASEVGQHAFCARSWWLGRVKGYASTHAQEMASGYDAHLAHGRAVVRYHHLQRLGYVLLAMAALAGALGIYLLIQGL